MESIDIETQKTAYKLTRFKAESVNNRSTLCAMSLAFANCT